MGKGRSLKLTLYIDQPHGLGDISRMCIYKTNVLISTDVFRHFGGQLQMECEVDSGKLRKFIFIGFRRCQAKFECQCTQNMPCYTVIFAVRVSVANYQ